MRALVPLPVLGGLAALVAAASLGVGGIALYRDLRAAFRDSGPSVFAASVAGQIQAIRHSVPPGASILLTAADDSDGKWYGLLFQRALFPRNRVIVRYLPLSRADMQPLVTLYSIRYALAVGPPASNAGFRVRADLGPLPGLPYGVSFGEFAP